MHHKDKRKGPVTFPGDSAKCFVLGDARDNDWCNTQPVGWCSFDWRNCEQLLHHYGALRGTAVAKERDCTLKSLSVLFPLNVMLIATFCASFINKGSQKTFFLLDPQIREMSLNI